MLRLNFIGSVLKDWTKNVLENGTTEYVIRVSVVEPYTDKDGKVAQTANLIVLKMWRKAENVADFESKLKVGVIVFGSVEMPTTVCGKNEKTSSLYGYFYSQQVKQLVFIDAQKADNFITIQALGGITADAQVQDLKHDTERKAINFSVACSERVAGTDEKGYPNRNTVFVNGSLFRAADKTNVAGYLLKGQKIYAEGRPVVRTNTDKEGNPRAFFNAEFTNVEFVGGRTVVPGEPETPTPPDFGTATNDDDLPF